MSKQRRWYGRPNPPPLGWETLGRPPMRRVSGHADDLLPVPPAPSSEPYGKPVSVALPNAHWERILKMFTVYGQAHGDADWQRWRKRVREAVLLATNPNTNETRPAVVTLPLDDWRALYRCVRQACDEGPTDEWRRWFAWLSRKMVEQIGRQMGGAHKEGKN